MPIREPECDVTLSGAKGACLDAWLLRFAQDDDGCAVAPTDWAS